MIRPVDWWTNFQLTRKLRNEEFLLSMTKQVLKLFFYIMETKIDLFLLYQDPKNIWMTTINAEYFTVKIQEKCTLLKNILSKNIKIAVNKFSEHSCNRKRIFCYVNKFPCFSWIFSENDLLRFTILLNVDGKMAYIKIPFLVRKITKKRSCRRDLC